MKAIVPVVAVGAVIINDHKVLLVKRAHAPARGQWAIPGGRVEAGETLQQALKREIREETGLDIDIGPLAHVFDLIERSAAGLLTRHYVIIDYEATIVGGTLQAGDDALKIDWFGSKDLPNTNISPATIDLLKNKYAF